MVTEMKVRVKLRRKGGEKSKTGCLTCRIRRVKCDETRPCCRRCTSTGRECEGPVSHGYSFVQQDSPPSMRHASPASTLHVVPKSTAFKASEGRSFQFFLLKAAPELSGSLDTYFWEQLIPQLSESNPVIRNSVLAISKLYEHPFYSTSSDQGQEPCPVMEKTHHQALESYNKAIAAFNHGIYKTPEDIPVALISCVLFICIELQQGGFFNALALLKRGLALQSSGFATSATAYEEMTAVDQTITELFSRLAGLASTLGVQVSSNAPITAFHTHLLRSGPSSFSTLHEARSQLYLLKDNSHGFLQRSQTHLKKNLLPTADLVAEQQELLSELGAWRAQFERLEAAATDRDIIAASLLSVTQDALCIILSTHLDQSQTTYDHYCGIFERIVARAEVALGSDLVKKSFTLDTGFIMPLHFVAVKCREPQIRRHALSLIKRCPAKECWWSAQPHFEIAEKSIMVEEQSGGRLVEFPVMYGETEGSALSYEHKRVYHLEVVEDPISYNRLDSTPRPGRYLDPEFVTTRAMDHDGML